MNKLIIVALCLTSVWACSDDNISTPDVVEFPLIEAILLTDSERILNDTVGNIAKYGQRYNQNDENDLIVFWNKISLETEIMFRVHKQQEVKIILITAEASQELKDSLYSSYGINIINHDKYAIITDEVVNLEQGQHIRSLNTKDINKGAYLVKVIREDVEDSYFPIVVDHPLANEEG